LTLWELIGRSVEVGREPHVVLLGSAAASVGHGVGRDEGRPAHNVGLVLILILILPLRRAALI
jgi:hypothetical protein